MPIKPLEFNLNRDRQRKTDRQTEEERERDRQTEREMGRLRDKDVGQCLIGQKHIESRPVNNYIPLAKAH